MSEEIGCTIVFGGKVKRSDVDRIEQALQDHDLHGESLADCAKARSACVGSGSTNYGHADDVETLLIELDLPFRRTADAKYEYDGEGVYWDGKAVNAIGEAAPQAFSCTQDGTPYLTLSDLQKTKEDGGTLEIAIERLAFVSAPLPAIEIIEDGDNNADEA
jgi:hypothetical protein